MPTRDETITGLRTLADLLEIQPELPVPNVHVTWPFWGNDPAELAAAAKLIPCKLIKNTPSTDPDHHDFIYYTLTGNLGGLDIQLWTMRSTVCTKVVVATREETEEIPDPDLVAGLPKVTRTKTVEDFAWECHPLLASVDAAAAAENMGAGAEQIREAAL